MSTFINKQSSYENNSLTRWLSPPIDTKFTLTIDQLELSLESHKKNIFNQKFIVKNYARQPDGSFIINENLFLKESTNEPSNPYLYCYNVIYNNQIIGYLSTDNKKRYSYWFLNFEFDKKVLYENNFYRYYSILLDSFPVYFSNIRYIEIALDTNYPFVDGFKEVYDKTKNWNVGEVLFDFVNKVTVSPMEDGDGSKIVEKKTSSSKVGVSKKGVTRTKEIFLYKKPCVDSYIKAFHLENGLDPDMIHRVEARLDNKYLKAYGIVKVEDVMDKNIVHALFVAAIGINFQVKDLSSKYWDHNRTKKHEVYDLLSFAKGNAQAIKRVKRSKNNAPQSVRNEWIVIKNCLFKYIETKKERYFNEILFTYKRLEEDTLEQLHRKLMGYIKSYDKVISDEIVKRVNSLLHMNMDTTGKKQAAMPFKENFHINESLQAYLEEMALIQGKTKAKILREAIIDKYIRHVEETSTAPGINGNTE